MATETEPLTRFPRVPASGAQLPPLVLLAGFGEPETAELRSLLEGDCRVATARSLAEARTALQDRQVAVLCFGRLLSPLEARSLLQTIPASGYPLVLLTAAGPEPELFQDLIDEDRLFYLSQGELPPRELSELVRSALARSATNHGPAAGQAAPAGLRQALQAARRVAAQPDLASAGELLQIAVEEAVEADRTYCLLYDPEREVLWSRSTGLEGEERHESSAVGLVSFVAHTARPVRVERAVEDPRYEREADDPLGKRCEHLLAVPIHEEKRVLAVLCAVRDPGRDPFSPADEAALELLASTVAPPLAQLDLAARLENEGRSLERKVHARTVEIFREEAVEHHANVGSREGDWLRLSPRWTNATFWLLLALVGAFLAYSLIGTIDEYATGPAVVRLSGRTEVTASQEGIVTAVEVRPGDRVAAGQPLVRFQSARETAELRRIEREWDLQLIEHLRDLSAPGPSQALIALQAERDLARARVEERMVRAPRAGLVRDVRSRPNQHVGSGDILLSLTGAASLPMLTAMLPGEHRPLLQARMPLILELRGYGHAPQRLAITAVAEEVVDPDEARRLLGPEVARAVTVNGPVVLVEARFPDVAFEADGKRYELHDGMWGTAEVRVRSEPLLAALVPGLRAVLERLRD